MKDKADNKDTFMLGDWRVSPLEGRLEHDGTERRIQPKSMDVLQCLAQRPGEVVTREEILNTVWGDRAVADDPLTRCIGEIRRALGDSASAPRYVETIPKRGYRLLLPASNAVATGPTHDRPTSLTAIAVLPFADMTPQQDHGYFGDGLAEEIINILAQVPALRVAARTSSFGYRGTQRSIPEIGSELKVDYVVEGSVRRQGPAVRVYMQLLRTADGFAVWSEQFDYAFADVFDLQEQIARKVVAALELNVLDRPQTRRTTPEAYALYLRARHCAREGSVERMHEGISYLEELLDIDPEYAPAWSELANSHINLAGQGHTKWDDGFTLAREAALQACQQDPNYFGGYKQLAWIAHRYIGDLPEAMRRMQQAIALDSSGFELRKSAAVLLIQFGRLGKAVDLLRQCAESAPTDPRVHFNLAVVLKYLDRLEEADELLRRVLQLSPDYHGVPFQQGEVALLSSRWDDAATGFRRTGGFQEQWGLGAVAHALGDAKQAAQHRAALVEGWADEQPLAIAQLCAYQNDADEAFSWLARDGEAFGFAGWGEIRHQRWFDSIKADVRWQQLLERAGVDPEALSDLNLTF